MASELFKQYGPLVALSLGGGTRLYSPHKNCLGTVLVYGPEATQEVCSQHNIYHKMPLSGRLFPLGKVSRRRETLRNFATGLFAVNGQEHRQHRRLMLPAFHKQRVPAYHDDMAQIALSVFQRWQEGDTQDISLAMQEVTKRIATKTLFGEDIGPDGRGTGSLIQDSLRRLSHPLTRLLPFDIPGLPFHRFLNEIAQLQAHIQEIIARKRASGTDGNDVLSMLLKAHEAEGQQPLSEFELLGHVGVLFAAGHETSANALTWTLFLLTQHPQIYADLCDELAPLSGTIPTVDQLAHCQLLENVIKESLRVLPPVPWNARVTSQNTELLGHPLPAGTEVFLSIYQTHHSADIYAQPEQFNPRRWEQISPSPYEYQPFSAGPRLCLGATFAMLEIKLVLILLLNRFRLNFASAQPVNRVGNIVLAPQHSITMRLTSPESPFPPGGGVRGTVRQMVELPA